MPVSLSAASVVFVIDVEFDGIEDYKITISPPGLRI